MLQHRKLRDASERPRLASRKVLQPPEIGNGVDGQHGRGIIALLLDQLADPGRRPCREFRHRRDGRFFETVLIGRPWLGGLRLRRIPPVTLLQAVGLRLSDGRDGQSGKRGRQEESQPVHRTRSMRVSRAIATGP